MIGEHPGLPARPGIVRQTREILDQDLPQPDRADVSSRWHDVLIAHILFREAAERVAAPTDANRESVAAPIRNE